MRNPPTQQWLDWPPRNLINPEKQGLSLEIVGITMLALSVICVALRLYVRVGILHNAGRDDWLVLVSLVPAIGMTSSTLLGTRYGWGMHIYDSDPLWFKPSLLVSWIGQLLFVITVTLVKMSIIYSYRRLSDKRGYIIALNCTKIFIMLWGTAYFFMVVFRCWPVSVYWTDLTTRENSCMDENIPLLSSSILNLFSDVWLVALPLPILASLRLPFRQKMILIILMSMGLVACLAGVIRVYYLHKTLVTYDVTWEGYNTWIWTAVEVDLGIISTSIAPLRPLVRRYFPTLIENSVSFRDSCQPSSGFERDHPQAPQRIMSTVLGASNSPSSPVSPRRTAFNFSLEPTSRANDSEESLGMEMGNGIAYPDSPRKHSVHYRDNIV